MGNEHSPGVIGNTFLPDHGYRVVEVRPNSPAGKAGLEPFLDFVLYQPTNDSNRKLLFSEYLQENIGKEIILKVYNMIQQGTRLVHFDLTSLAFESIELQSAKSLHEAILGLKLRYEKYDDAHHNILAVADVYLGSPAQEADLQPFKDYIVGTKELTFGNLDFFAKFITVNKDRPTELYVYNVDVEEVRCAIVTPRDNWSG